jgi:hypothetical protein
MLCTRWGEREEEEEEGEGRAVEWMMSLRKGGKEGWEEGEEGSRCRRWASHCREIS